MLHIDESLNKGRVGSGLWDTYSGVGLWDGGSWEGAGGLRVVILGRELRAGEEGKGKGEGVGRERREGCEWDGRAKGKGRVEW